MKQNDIISIIQDNNISEYYSLKNLGIEGYAFPYQEALKIVQICKLLVIPILGGDVYSMNNSTIENSDDNWYYDRTPNESFYDYVQNSCNKSESYIRTFINHFCDKPLFSFEKIKFNSLSLFFIIVLIVNLLSFKYVFD